MNSIFKNFSADRKRVAKNYFYVSILQGLNFLLPLLILPILEFRLDLEKFGLVMYAQYVMSFCLVFTDFGFNITATREVAILKEQKEDLSKFYSSVFWSRIMLIIAVFLVLCIVVFSVDRFSTEWQVYLFSYGVVAGQAIFPVWFFQGIEKMQIITIIHVVAKCIFTILIVLFVKDTSDYLLVPTFNSIGFMVAGILSLAISFKYVSLKCHLSKDFWQFYKDSLSVTLSNISSSSVVIANGLILGFFHGDAIVGIYSLFEKLVVASKSVFMPIYQVLYPFVSRKTAQQTIELMKKMIPIIGVIGLVLSAFLFFLGEWILDMLFTNAAIFDYIGLFKIMTIVAFTSSLTMLYATLYAPSQRLFNRRLQVLTTGAVLTILLGLLFTPRYGIISTVYIFTALEIFLMFMCAFFYFFKDVPKARKQF